MWDTVQSQHCVPMITAMERQPKSWPVRRGPRSWAWVVRKERFSLLSCWSWTKGYESLEFPYYWIKAYLRLEPTQSRAGNWKVQIPLASCEFMDIAMHEAKLSIHVLITKATTLIFLWCQFDLDFLPIANTRNVTVPDPQSPISTDPWPYLAAVFLGSSSWFSAWVKPPPKSFVQTSH